MRMFRNLEEARLIDGVRALATGKMTSTMLELAIEMESGRRG